MITHNLIQGSKAWHEHRAKYFNASDAAAMLGISPYETRDELLERYKTGITPEVDAHTQRIFDQGHRAEALARPLAEQILGEELSPTVGTKDNLSASFDGITFLGDTTWEHKLLSARLKELTWTDDAEEFLPEDYLTQMEQQLMVSDAENCLFMATAWDDQGRMIEERHCIYTSNAERHRRIIDGWNQFAKDLDTFVPTTTERVTATVVESLPSVVVQVQGQLQISDNLKLFGDALKAYTASIPAVLETDQEFADAEQACKTLKKAEEALTQAEGHALAQISSVEQMTRTVADLKNLARTTRLATEKLVNAEKESRKFELTQQAQEALEKHAHELNAELLKADAGQLPPVPRGTFGPAVKGLKTITSMKDKVTAALLAEKSSLNEMAQRLRTNRDLLKVDGRDWMFLFRDFSSMGLNETQAFQSIATGRIAEHEKAEAERLEAERQRIRAEEERKAREAAEREAEAERQRMRIEEEAKAKQEAIAAQEPAEPITTAQPETTAAAPEVPAIEPEPQPVEVDGKRIKLNELSAKLGFTVTSTFLESLGFPAVARERASILYREADFGAICQALIEHIREVSGND